MIKNKTLHIKIIFKTYFKIFKISQKMFVNILLFYKILENNFQKPFFKIVFENGY